MPSYNGLVLTIMSIATAPAGNTNESNHPYAGLEKANTNYASWFNPQDVSETEDFQSDSDWRKTHKRTYWKHLDTQHRGHKNGAGRANKPFQTYLSNRHLSQSLATVLGLTKAEKSKTKKWFRLLKFDRLGYDIRLSAFCVCLYLVKDDEFDERQAHPNTKTQWPPEFRDYYDSLPDEQRRLLSKAYGKVASEIRSWTIGEDEPANVEMDKYGVADAQFDA